MGAEASAGVDPGKGIDSGTCAKAGGRQGARADADALLALMTQGGAFAIAQLDHWVATVPDAPFYYDGPARRWLPFAEVGERSDAVADNLAGYGIEPGDKVGLYVAAHFPATCILLGIWKVDAVYAPMNTSFTGDLLAYQINDSGVRILFVQETMADNVRAVLPLCPGVEKVILVGRGADGGGTDGEVSGGNPGDWPVPVDLWHAWPRSLRRVRIANRPSSPAMIIYTSGTTGPAKGVVLPHRWIAQFLCIMGRIITPDDVVYNDLPMYHIGGAIANIVRAVWTGSRVACWERFSVSDFWNRVEESGATYCTLMDTMITWLCKAPPSDRDRFNTMNKVHMQPLPADHHAVARRFGFDMVSTGFGQTETGGVMHAFIETCAHGEGTPLHLYHGLTPEQRRAILAPFGACIVRAEDVTARFLGKPAFCHEVAVVDEHDEPCPPGVAGELAVRPRLQHMLIKEYLGKPQATAHAFRNLWFHTGDAVVDNGDGTYRFISRLGDRIRVRGENVAAFDVEDILGRHEGVALCAALGIPAHEGEEDDIAVFIVPSAGATPSVQNLRDWAEQAMPKYMRPRHYRILNDMPRTPSNKIEKYKLRNALLAELAEEA